MRWHSTALAACVLAAIALLLGPPAAGAEKVTLALKLKPGRVYRMEFVADQKIRMTIESQTIDTRQTMGCGYAFDVRGVKPDGTAECRVTYDSMLFKQEGPSGKTEYDSKNPPDILPANAKAYASLVGQSFTLHITSTGQVTGVAGVDAIIETACKAVGLPNNEAADQVRKQIKEQFGDDAMREIFEKSLAIYPEQPVGIGDSWNKSIVVRRGFPMILQTTYTLKELRNGTAIVDVAGKVGRNPDGKPIQMGPMELSYDLSGDQKGTIEMEQASGWIDDAKLAQDFSGTVTIRGIPGQSQPLTCPVSLEGKVRTSAPK